jgi:pilus assembly protein Flp/PilA
MENLKRFLKDDDGTAAIEYAVLASLIAAAIATTVGTLGLNVKGLYEKITF